MDEGDKLAQELLEFRIEHTRKYPHLPLVFEPKLIARVVNYLVDGSVDYPRRRLPHRAPPGKS